MDDFVFYLLDGCVIGMFLYMTWRSHQVIVEAKTGNKWIVPAMFIGMGVLGFVNYTGVFNWIQLIVMISLGVMYFLFKSGLSEKGIIMAGSFISYEKAGKLTLSKKDNCLSFDSRGRRVDLYFTQENMDEARRFLNDRNVQNKTVKRK